MTSKIIKSWLSLGGYIPKLLKLKIVAIIFFGGSLEIIGLGAIFPVLNILLDSKTIEKYQKYMPLEFHDANNFLIFLLIFCLIFYILKNIFLSYSIFEIFNSVFFLQDLLSKKLFENLLTSDYTNHRNLDINKQSSVLVNDIPLVCIQWYLPVIYLLVDSITIIFLLLFLGWMNPLLLIATGAIGLILFSSILIFSRRYSYKWGAKRKHFDEIKLDLFINGLSHIKEIIAYGKISYYLNEFNRANTIASKSAMLQSTAQVVPKFFVESIAVFTLLGIIFFLLVGGFNVQKQIPVIGIYAVAAFRIIPTINRMMQSYQMVEYGLDSTIGLIDCLPQDPIAEKKNIEFHAIAPLNGFEMLNIENVVYSYNKAKKNVLNQLSLNVLKGEKIAIVGESGVGKSTLIDILLGLNIPGSGFVGFNNQSIFDSLAAWRSLIGYVPQRLHLTSTSLRDNIIFSAMSSEVDENLLKRVVKITGIDRFMGDDLEESLGREGAKISGGQNQRIAIARALYKKPEVLIFDEATSALDEASEFEIMSNILNEFPGITLISVTHKIYKKSIYSKIYQLKNGQIDQGGLHETSNV
ncbi:ABC transporter ATP-binding protein [Polynucleobacter paneuropaeus]|jgi:ABC-type bacteriocin/lantibiotic exporter with double-glycine peptidase domain|nr:ABC transporter ATP-binding protein [Polynucleobacter paneuropaeus]